MQRGKRLAVLVTCAVLSQGAPARAQVSSSVSRLSGLRDTTVNSAQSAITGFAPGSESGGAATVATPSNPILGTAVTQGIVGAPVPSGSIATGSTTVNNATTVNGIQYRLTPGGTYVPGYGPSGGIAYLPGTAGDAPQQQDVRQPPQPDLGLDQKITHLEALDGLTYADTVQMERTIKRYQLVDSVKVLSESERRVLRQKIVDSPVATGAQNILSRFLRDAELIQAHHIVVGVIPRKNMILIGLRSSEEG